MASSLAMTLTLGLDWGCLPGATHLGVLRFWRTKAYRRPLHFAVEQVFMTKKSEIKDQIQVSRINNSHWVFGHLGKIGFTTERLCHAQASTKKC
jgi:hypothetical protein